MTSGPGTDPVVLWAHRLAGAERRTGVGRYGIGLTRALAAGAGGDVPWRYELAAGPERELITWVPPNVAVRSLGRNRRLLHLSWTALHRPRIERFLGPVGLVHCLLPAFPVPARAPVVVTVHDLFPLEHPEWFGRASGWASRRTLRWAIDHAAHLVTDSEHARAKLIADHGVDAARVTAVWLGIDEQFGAAAPRDRNAAVLARYGLDPGGYAIAVGAINERKNLATVLEALALLPPPFALVVAGPEGQRVEQFRAAAARLGVAERVRVTGFLPDEDLAALVAGAAVLVHPSLDEGFGFTPLEAMSLGTPVVVSSSGSLPEVVGDAAVVVSPTEPEAWAAAISAVRDDPARRQALIDAGRSRAATFTWARTAEATASVHRLVLSAG